MKYFWNYRRCGTRIHTKIIKAHTSVSKWQRRVLFLPISVLVVFSLRPVISSSKFIYYSWTPGDSIIFNISILITQYYLTVLITPIIYGCDFLYVSYSVHVASQIYLLNCELKNLQAKSCKADLHEYIKHHQLILS